MGLLDQVRSKVLKTLNIDIPAVTEDGVGAGDYRWAVALGVLLQAVAEADDRFMPAERNAMLNVLSGPGGVAELEIGPVVGAIQVAAAERIDLHSFASDVAEGLSYAQKVNVIEHLFRVAFADKDLDPDEEAMIRTIAGLLRVEHAEFIEAKLKVKNKLGPDASGR
jgi:uncharacterized tellurite resistance protein B-like protein